MQERRDTIEVPARGTRGAGLPLGWLLRKLMPPFMRLQISRYRKSAGPTPPVMMGFPTVLLTTIGAKTGLERTAVLGGFSDGDDAWLIMASLGGAASHPAWFLNLAKDPERVWLEVGNRRLRVRPQLLKGAAREAALAKIATIAPRYGAYQDKTDREIPILRLTPVAL